MSLLNRFKDVVASQPDAIAVKQGDNSFSYRELNRTASSVAWHLQDLGVSRGDRVALVLPNSFEYIAVFYGIWLSGGITVALNTQAKASDIINWVEHSDAEYLFIDENHPELGVLDELIKTDVTIVPVNCSSSSSHSGHSTTWQKIVNGNFEYDSSPPSRDDVASIIYTSGTSGSPKGVTLTHGNLNSNIDSILGYLTLSSRDSIVNVLPFFYSYGNSILHTHLAVGARLVLENSLLYPHRVVELIANESVTGFSGVPSTYSLILARVKLEEFSFPSLRYMTQAGGPMSPTLSDKILTALPNIDFFIMYGQTEATARLTYLPPKMLRKKRGSVGIPIPGVTIEIKNKNNKNVSVGETGEIYAKGDNIMRGYWKDESSTLSTLREGWLHTGDLAHYDSDGYLYIDGRSSDMIKTGGNRISPKEIEEVIQELDGVEEVAVVGLQDDILGEVIKAFIIPIPKSGLKEMAVRRHCKENLANYKIPKSIEFIKTLPKTASGKIKRFLLK